MTTTLGDTLGDRQQIILDATLELVATHGLLGTSVSKISKLAESSPGILYHYFDSKDEIIHTLYRNTFHEMMTYLVDGLDLDQPCLERYKRLWLRNYQFHIANPAKTIFIEQYKNSSYYKVEQEQETFRVMSGLIDMVQQDIDDGLVVDLPLDVIHTMTMTAAVNLAKLHLYDRNAITQDKLNLIAERVCRSVLM